MIIDPFVTSGLFDTTGTTGLFVFGVQFRLRGMIRNPEQFVMTVRNGTFGSSVTILPADTIDITLKFLKSGPSLIFGQSGKIGLFIFIEQFVSHDTSPSIVTTGFASLFVSRNIVSIQCRKTKSNGIPKILRGRATGSNSTATGPGDSHGRQPRATATGDSHGRQRREPATGDSHGRQPRGRATGPGDGEQLDSHGAGRQPRATGSNST